MMTTEMTGSVNPNAEQDQSAVTAVRNGDAERYRELVERHERQVFAVAWSRLGDAALAEEVTQEAFIRAYRRLWLLGDGAKFSGWVNTIARRVAINFGLRHRRELNKRERWALENPANQSADEADALHTPETLRQTLTELPGLHRECLVLFYLEGKSGAETAAALGISETALRTRLHRARAAMRERLEEKLEGSLTQLRPSKALVPAVMGAVLASTSGKATAGAAGAGAAGVLAKIGFAKLALPFASFFSFLFFLPFLALNWFMNRLELKNYRDQEGFRARLFRENTRRGLIWFLPSVAIFLLFPHLNFANSKIFYLVIAAICLIRLPFQIRQLAINRSPYVVSLFASCGLIALSLLAIGFGWVPLSWVFPIVMLQPLLLFRYQNLQPRRMDYNLFLRAAEGLLQTDGPGVLPKKNFTKTELFAFARFLGGRWMLSGYRLHENRLELRLSSANVTPGGLVRSFPGFARAWAERSRLSLQTDGRATAALGPGDRKILQRLQGDRLPSDAALENTVARAVESAWEKFRAGDTAAAERALGEVTDAEVFIKPRTATVSARVRRAIVVGCLLFALGTFFLNKYYGLKKYPVATVEELTLQNYKLTLQELKYAKTEPVRFTALDDAAKQSFVAGKIDDARNYAQELMTLAPKYKDNWNYGNAIQDANLVLGRIAVREGNLEAAKKFLLAAGNSPGSARMNSFGPNVTLAQDLLEKGDRTTVLEYLDLCRKFWKTDHGKLDQWTQEIRDGKTPDFGANLLY